MIKEVKDAWLTALRSGKYEQGRGRLRSKDNKYCCLGVLVDIVLSDPDQKEQKLDINRSLGGLLVLDSDPKINNNIERECITLNDVNKYNFNEIADWVETNVKVS